MFYYRPSSLFRTPASASIRQYDIEISVVLSLYMRTNSSRQYLKPRTCRKPTKCRRLQLHLTYHAWCPPETSMLRMRIVVVSGERTRKGCNSTHSLPVQKVLASLASHVTTPRSSSGRPSRLRGFAFAYSSRSSGCTSKYACVILKTARLTLTLCAPAPDALGVDIARAERIDPDSVDAELARHAACHLQDGGL